MLRFLLANRLPRVSLALTTKKRYNEFKEKKRSSKGCLKPRFPFWALASAILLCVMGLLFVLLGGLHTGGLITGRYLKAAFATFGTGGLSGAVCSWLTGADTNLLARTGGSRLKAEITGIIAVLWPRRQPGYFTAFAARTGEWPAATGGHGGANSEEVPEGQQRLARLISSTSVLFFVLTVLATFFALGQP